MNRNGNNIHLNYREIIKFENNTKIIRYWPEIRFQNNKFKMKEIK